jgi:hypothetical protein
MSMSELMSMADLSLWPQLALVVFLGVFVLVMRRLWKSPASEINHGASLPFDEGEITSTTSAGSNR